MLQREPVRVIDTGLFRVEGYARSVPFGCVGSGLLSLLYFLPGQAMAPHRHLDSEEYFTALAGRAEMVVNGSLVPLSEGETFLRLRGTLHALRNPGPEVLIVQSFQCPLPSDEATRWGETVAWWSPAMGCSRCWCGHVDGEGRCANCGMRAVRNIPGVPHL